MSATIVSRRARCLASSLGSAAEARAGRPREGRAEVEATLAEVRPLEDFFAYPGHRLLKALAERVAADDAMGAGRLVRRISGASAESRAESVRWRITG